MGIKLTETELNNLLAKNSKLKISSSLGKNNNQDNIKIDVKEKKPKKKKLSILEEVLAVETKEKNKGVKVSDINKLNKEAITSFSSSEEHVSILFDGAKLLSVNQIFAILQYRKYEIFAYKKVWHEIIGKILNDQFIILKSQNKELPFFNEAVEITLFRQASRLVDEDAMSTMFKYIIDGLKRDKNNPNGILAEDNPKIVHRIVCFSEKGVPAVGIKVKKITEKKQKFTIEDILKQ